MSKINYMGLQIKKKYVNMNKKLANLEDKNEENAK
jgi:hypothetical protein